MTTFDYVMGYGSLVWAAITAIGAFVFVFNYGIFAKWWKDAMGWHLISFTFAVFLAFGFTVANALGWTRGLGLTVNLIIEFLVFALCAAVVWWRNIILFQTQILKRRIRNAASRGQSGQCDDDARREVDSQLDR